MRIGSVCLDSEYQAECRQLKFVLAIGLIQVLDQSNRRCHRFSVPSTGRKDATRNYSGGVNAEQVSSRLKEYCSAQTKSGREFRARYLFICCESILWAIHIRRRHSIPGSAV
jgi:hypothetical protein